MVSEESELRIAKLEAEVEELKLICAHLHIAIFKSTELSQETLKASFTRLLAKDGTDAVFDRMKSLSTDLDASLESARALIWDKPDEK